MTKVLVVDDVPIFCDALATALKASGYEATCAYNGSDALSMVRFDPPDLILLDLAMPHMDGLSFLHHLRRFPEPHPPVVLLTGVAEREKVLHASQLGVKQYLLKTAFQLPALIKQIEFALKEAKKNTSDVEVATVQVEQSASTASDADTSPVESNVTDLKSIKPIIRRSQIAERLDRAGELKAMSPAVAQALELTSNTNAPVDQVAGAISNDPSLSLKLLRLANSNQHSRGKSVTTVEEAIVRLGMNNVRMAVTSAAVMDNFNDARLADAINMGEFWEHSIAVGLIASIIAKTREDIDASALFTMGMLHDIGKLLLTQEFPDEYQRVCELAESLGLPVEQVEKRLLMTTHAECIDRVLHAWQFPRELINPIVHHHRPLSDVRNLAAKQIGEIVTLILADQLSHAVCLGSSGNDVIYPVDECCRELKLDESTMHSIEEKIIEEAQRLKVELMMHAEDDMAWGDRAAVYRSQLPDNLSVQFIGAQPELDAYRIFFGRVCGGNEQDTPNAVVVHARDQHEVNSLASALANEERTHGVDKLPTLVIVPDASVKLDVFRETHRRLEVLESPTRSEALVAVIGNMCRFAQAA